MAKRPTIAQLQKELRLLEVYRAAWMFQDREKVVFKSGSHTLVAVALASPTGGVCWFRGSKSSPFWVTDAVRDFRNATDIHVRNIGEQLHREHCTACGLSPETPLPA